MNKPRVLWVGEFTALNTGYGVYGREILSRLYDTGKYEIAELSSYGFSHDSRHQYIPWTTYPCMFEEGNEQDKAVYNSDPANQFGKWKFEPACIDFKPTHVLAARDFWYDSFTEESPFRPFYNLSWMPTVDSYPQADEWIDTMSRVDNILTYSEWGGEVLKYQSGGRIKPIGTASPAAAAEFQPVEDKGKHKEGLGFSRDSFIVGMISRNQERKLFPDLMAGFREFLDETNAKNTFLYLHTSYPDNRGWDIPRLLKDYRLSSKVLFTYACKDCGHVFPTFFQDAFTVCTQCGRHTARPCDVNLGVPNEVLAKIYNLFDVYVQYVTNEGFGMGQVEAACCGVPVIGTDYSAVSSVLKNIGGLPIEVQHYNKEIISGAFRAIPQRYSLVQSLKMFHDMSQRERKQLGLQTSLAARRVYNWDKSAARWMDIIDSNPMEDKWVCSPRIKNIPNQFPQGMNNSQFTRWLILNVLQEPRYINSYLEMKTIRDLNHVDVLGSHSPFHLNDESFKNHWHLEPTKFTQETAYNLYRAIAERHNHWERVRCNVS